MAFDAHAGCAFFDAGEGSIWILANDQHWFVLSAGLEETVGQETMPNTDPMQAWRKGWVFLCPGKGPLGAVGVWSGNGPFGGDTCFEDPVFTPVDGHDDHHAFDVLGELAGGSVLPVIPDSAFAVGSSF